MRNLKSREIMEMVALHGLCTQYLNSGYLFTVTVLAETAKHIATEWAKLNPEICDKEG